jgi:hypothetical protein
MLLRCEAVENHINPLRLDGVEEANELLMPMPPHVASDDRAATSSLPAAVDA